MRLHHSLLFLSVITNQVFGATFQVTWDLESKPDLDVGVGDVIEFTWTDDISLDVYQNPSLDCDLTEALPLYSPATSGGSFSYTIQDEDAGGEIFFAASDVTNCENGASLLVNVLDTTPVPTSAPSAPNSVSTLIPSATVAPLPTMMSTLPLSQNPTSSMAPSISILPTEEVFAEYLDSPELKWSVQLVNTGASTGAGIGPGNAVTVSPDGLLVYVTLDNGRLEVLSASSGETRFSYIPPVSAQGWVTSCKSGVTFSQLNGVKYAIYAIIDVPPSGVSEDVQSRIVSVSQRDNKILWVSDLIPGEIQGKPLVTETSPGEYIFFTHNQLNMTTGELYGSVSMILADSGMLAWTENAGDSSTDPNPDDLQLIDDLRLPYGPIGVAHFPKEGRYPGGEENSNDIFVWGTSVDEGLGPSGYTRAFQLPRIFDPVFADTLSTTFLKDNRWNTITSPTLSRDGMNLYFGIRQHRLRGWTGVLDFDQLANLVVDDFPENPTTPRTPTPFPPVLSISEERLFVGLTVPLLYSLESQSGTVQWELAGNSTPSGPVSVSPEDGFIYLTWADGTVMAVSQDTGIPLWSIQCNDIDPARTTLCQDEILGESSLSPNGLVFFYGDITGNVKALQVGFALLNTTAPSAFPSEGATAAPTRSPSSSPTGTTETPSVTSPGESTTSSPSTPSMVQTPTPSVPETGFPTARPNSSTSTDEPTPPGDDSSSSGHSIGNYYRIAADQTIGVVLVSFLLLFIAVV